MRKLLPAQPDDKCQPTQLRGSQTLQELAKEGLRLIAGQQSGTDERIGNFVHPARRWS